MYKHLKNILWLTVIKAGLFLDWILFVYKEQRVERAQQGAGAPLRGPSEQGAAGQGAQISS